MNEIFLNKNINKVHYPDLSIQYGLIINLFSSITGIFSETDTVISHLKV